VVSTIVVTGANGFLGQSLLGQAARQRPETEIVAIPSHRAGGIDLAADMAPDWLSDKITLEDPSDALLIHAAAVVEWNTSAGLLKNVAIAINLAQWSNSIGIRFSVLVSAVNVYPAVPKADVQTPCDPRTLYGLGKWAAERVWQLSLPAKQQATIRLAGLWGWQPKPTLCWNRLLLAAARGFPAESRPFVRRRCSRRNYISVNDAANCLLAVGKARQSGLFLAAGGDVVDVGEFIQALSALPGSRLDVNWQDDGGADESLDEPSPELLPMLTSFQNTLTRLWEERPSWVVQGIES